MATASAGTTGSLSTTDMRTLLKATNEIEALAVTTAMHLKALTDRSDGSKQLLESVMGSFVGSLAGTGISRVAFDPPTRVNAALIKVSPPLVQDFPNRTTFDNGIFQKIWDCIETFRGEVFEIENAPATMDDTDKQREPIVPLRTTMVGDIEQMMLRFTDDVRRQTRDEIEIMSVTFLTVNRYQSMILLSPRRYGEKHYMDRKLAIPRTD